MIDREEALAQLARLRARVSELEGSLGARRPLPPAPEGLEQAAYPFIAEYGSDLISIHADNGDYLFASPNAERLTGWTAEELVGRNAYDLFHAEDLDAVSADHAAHQEGRDRRVRYRLRRKDGAYRWFETRSRARITRDGVEQIVCFTSDVHDEVLAERKIEAAEREVMRAAVEQLGARLAMGVAHEINNALAVLMLELQPDQLGPSGRAAMSRIESVVWALRLLSERTTDPKRLDLAREAARMLTLVPGTAADRVETELEPAPVHVAPARLHQLLHILTSIHVLHEGGRIRVRTGRETGQSTLQLTSDGADTWVASDFGALLDPDAPMFVPPLEVAKRIAAELGATLTHDATEDGATSRLAFDR